ncbi:hypothetical protein Hypma_014889 [Hypsizygus marmoreus]|uniref:F-box domain-containing protein n=1 Tax=Hypsizygus marmoreus TaxID=39966 RepID=A0A369K500_HYPMA|nr:hypothetical protein Hypma_014889 [Hypsizygus marmoreus]
MAMLESPFADVLNTNYVPTDKELTQIDGILSDALNAHSCLVNEIARMQAILDDLSTQRRNLEDHIRCHRALASQICRLPVEVFQIIFCYCLPSGRYSVMSTKDCPLLLGRVCSVWQKISRCTPQLWSSVHICVPETSELPGGGCKELESFSDGLNTWLSLSNTNLLSLSLVACPLHTSHPMKSQLPFNHLLCVLVRFSKRWRSASFIGPTDVFILGVRRLTKADVPELEVFNFQSLGGPGQSNSWDEVSMLNTSSLREISMLSYLSPTTLPVNWENLTRLHLAVFQRPYEDALDFMEALEIMSQCVNLLECAMSEFFTDFRVLPSHLQNITLPSLTTLRITQDFDVHSSFPAFFEPLHLPQLRTLSFRGYINGDTMPFCSLLRDTHNVENLDIHITTSNAPVESAVLNCLSLAVNIKRLHLHGSMQRWEAPLTDHILSWMTTPTSEGFPCPNLQEVVFHWCDFTEEAVRSFLLARTSPAQHGVAFLAKATFLMTCHRALDIRSDLAHAIKSGLDLILDYTASPEDVKPSYSVFSPWNGLDVVTNDYYIF